MNECWAIFTRRTPWHDLRHLWLAIEINSERYVPVQLTLYANEALKPESCSGVGGPEFFQSSAQCNVCKNVK